MYWPITSSARTCSAAFVAALSILTVHTLAQAAPPTLTTLYSFPGTGIPSAFAPYAPLLITANGVLYGTTNAGGTEGAGAVFALTPPSTAGGTWTESQLYSFMGSVHRDGALPSYGALVAGANGALYGTTTYGGSGPCANRGPYPGCGTIFQLMPPATPSGTWTETILYSFTGPPDGAYPYAGLTVDANGVLYGTTGAGGSTTYPNCPPAGFNSAAGCGTVFALTPPAAVGGAWTESVLYSFTGFTGQTGDGWQPHGGLVIGTSGALYGTTLNGGTNNFGTVFQLAPPATSGGAWTETILYSFANGQGKGSKPWGNLIMGKQGALFGTGLGGGPSPSCGFNRSGGEVFELLPPSAPGGAWTAIGLHAFGNSGDGCQPYSGVVMGRNGTLYGTTFYGGSANKGTVFWLTPPAKAGGTWTETIYSLTDDAYPYAGLALGPSGVLYGTTSAGGTQNSGSVFEWIP